MAADCENVGLHVVRMLIPVSQEDEMEKKHFMHNILWLSRVRKSHRLDIRSGDGAPGPNVLGKSRAGSS